IPGVDAKLLIKDATNLMPDASRRGFLRGAASLGALTFLTGCDIIDGETAEGVLRKISEFNDGAQAALFSHTKLAPTYPERAITNPLPIKRQLREGGGAGRSRKKLQTRSRRPRRKQEPVAPRRIVRVA